MKVKSKMVPKNTEQRKGRENEELVYKNWSDRKVTPQMWEDKLQKQRLIHGVWEVVCK